MPWSTRPGTTMMSRAQQLFRVDDNYQLASWLVLRGVALIYLIAFLSLAVQITGLSGPNGILPFEQALEHAYRNNGWRAWWYIPNVFWISASDTALLLAAWGGALFALLVLFGYWQTTSLVIAYVLYVSLFHAGNLFLSFQWDTLLMETGFLAIFLARGGPNRLLIFMFHWLLFRFRFMSGFFKLYKEDPTWLDLTTLHYYFETQVLPHGASWYFHQLPEWILSGGVLLVYFTELIVPFFIFLPRRWRITAAWITIFMQLLIMATSNHNFVNLLVIVLCIFLLDDRYLRGFIPDWLRKRMQINGTRRQATISKTLLAMASAMILLTSVFIFGQRTLQLQFPEPLRQTFATTMSLGIGHIFHVYPVMQVERQELEIQGSHDGVNWLSYSFKYKPGPVNQRPRMNIPHQPRLDWMMWFLPPQARSDDFWLHLFLIRLQQGSPQVLSLLEFNPFEGKPPRYLRVLAYDYRFTTREEKAETGDWWVREYLGVFPHVKPRRP